MQWINGALLIGILVQFTKLGDLLISDKQKQFIQEKIEWLILKIEYSGLLDQFYRIIEKKRFRKIINTLLVFINGICVCYFFFMLLGDMSEDNQSFQGENLTIAIGFTLLVSLIAWKAFQMYGFRILSWMFRKGRWGVFFARFLLFVVITNIPLMLLLIYDRYNFYPILIALLLFSGVLLVWFSISWLGTFLALYFLALTLLKFLLNILRWLLWRISEYNKGAVAAITLLITVVLGIVKVLQ